MLKWLFLLFLVACVTKEIETQQPHEYAEAPDPEIFQNGEAIGLRWKKPKGTDIAGYYIYAWKYLKQEKGYYFKKEKIYDVGHRLQYYIYYESPYIYKIFLRSYDTRGNKSFASKVKFYPRKPDDWDGGIIMMNLDLMDPWTGSLYKTGEDITIAWDGSAESTKYEVKMHFINDDAHISTTNYGETAECTMTMERPHGIVGLCEFFVRAYANGEWSEWVSSDSEMGQVTIDGEQQSGNWIVYWMLPAPVWE